MKPLTLIFCLLFLGCEKRVADPGLRKVRDILLSDQGSELLSMRGIAGNRLAPREQWKVRRFSDNMQPGYLVFAPLEIGEEGLIFEIDLQENRIERDYSGGILWVTFKELQFERFGNPIDRGKFRRWKGKYFRSRFIY